MHQAQQILRRLVVGRIIMTPVAERGLNPAYYTFSARGTVRPLIGNVPVGMASPSRRAPFREFALSVGIDFFGALKMA